MSLQSLILNNKISVVEAKYLNESQARNLSQHEEPELTIQNTTTKVSAQDHSSVDNNVKFDVPVSDMPNRQKSNTLTQKSNQSTNSSFVMNTYAELTTPYVATLCLFVCAIGAGLLIAGVPIVPLVIATTVLSGIFSIGLFSAVNTKNQRPSADHVRTGLEPQTM